MAVKLQLFTEDARDVNSGSRKMGKNCVERGAKRGRGGGLSMN